MKTLYILFIGMLVSSGVLAQSCLPEGITFETQAQIDSFQYHYPGCTEVEGNLIVRGQNITNLNGLFVLEKIGRSLLIRGTAIKTMIGLNNIISVNINLEIYHNDSLTTLSGLDNLKLVGDNILVESNRILEDITALNNLNTIGVSFQVVNNSSLQYMIGLDSINTPGLRIVIAENDSLEDISLLNYNDSLVVNELYIYDNHSLSVCNIDLLCEHLADPQFYIDIHNNAPGCNNPGEIAYQCGFVMPCYYGPRYFSNQSDIDHFKDYYINCPILSGDVVVSGNDINNLHGLNEIHIIEGNLIIKENEILTDLSGIGSLTSIKRGGYYWGNTHGHLTIENNDALNSLSGLNNLVSIEGYLIVGHPENGIGNKSLINLSGLDNLQTVGGVKICHNDLLSNLSGMESLDTIYNGIVISGNQSLSSLSDFNVDISFGDGFLSYVRITNNDALVDLSGLEFIDTIYHSLEIIDNDELSSLDGLNNLEVIEDMVGWWSTRMTIKNNDALVDLSGLENLKSLGYPMIDGSILIQGNQTLESLNGLENIDPLSFQGLGIKNNPNLSECEMKSICDYLSNPGYWGAMIDSNMVGCNSISEVLEICAFRVNEPILNQSCIVYPNPSSGTLNLRYSIHETRNSKLDLYSLHGVKIRTLLEEVQPPGEYELTFDISELPTGMYFIRLQTGKQVITEKVLLTK